MIYIWCVGFASHDVVYDELNYCAWYICLYQISDKCVYVYCVESFAHIECYSDYWRRVNHLVEPLCYGVINVCSDVTVECCVLYPCCVGVFGMFTVM